MVAFRYKNVCLESYATNLPPQELSSTTIEDRLAEVYSKLGIPFGTLERLTGISTRYFWPIEERPSGVATVAAKLAIENSGIDPNILGAFFSCSVTRDYFEPATACIVHRNLGLHENAIVLDVSNACLGFMDGIFLMANLIETGVVKAGVVVSGEHTRCIIDATFKSVLANKDTFTRDKLLRMLPSFTIGSGAVAYVLCHESISRSKHRILGGVTLSATEHSDLCEGNADYFLVDNPELNPIMETESSKLIAAAALLGQRAWKDASELLGWNREMVDHIFCHQVGKQVNEAFYNTLGLDYSKEFTIYQRYGNLVSAALPTALTMGVEGRKLKRGDKIVMTGFGSGLNALFVGIEW